MTRADKLRSLTTDELAVALFKLSVTQTVGFMQDGGAGCMNVIQFKAWLNGENEPDDEILSGKPFGEED